MKHMFGGNPWAGQQQPSAQGAGFRPGQPVPVNVSGSFQLSGAGPMASRVLPFRSATTPPAPKQMEGDCSDGSCQLPQPSNIRPNPNAIPVAGKGDCPVCRPGAGRSRF